MGYHKILIAGAGELGSRYLQGLAKATTALEIYVFDLNLASLRQAKERLEDVVNDKSIHKVKFIDCIKFLPGVVDVAIISTTAGSRQDVVETIDGAANISNWILEKVLAQSTGDIDKIQNILEDKRAWVNTPRRISSLYINLREAIKPESPTTIKVHGGSWGLACNAIHFLDLLGWMTNSQLLSIDASGLNSSWFESKRPGNWDVYGELIATYSNGSKLILTSIEGPYSLLVEMENGGNEWMIDEISGLAKCDDGKSIHGKLLMQSEMTSDVINKIIYEGKSDLPCLKDSSQIHKILIEELLMQWRSNMDINAKKLPIT